MSTEKKKIREAFRSAVFTRDGNHCTFCEIQDNLDAHHITPRKDMPNGGYVAENGITLCPQHHILAETYNTDGMLPDDLYQKIGSSYEQAVKASERLQ